MKINQNTELSKSPDEVRTSPITLGKTVVECHRGSSIDQGNGSSLDSGVVICQNFLPPLVEEDGVKYPVQIDGDPIENASLNFLALPCAVDNEIPITLTTQPGLTDYYRQIGLVSPDLVHHEVSPRPGATPSYSTHDPLSRALAETKWSDLSFELGDLNFVSAFTSENVRAQAAELGLVTIQTSNSFATNDKRAFREAASRYDFVVAPGCEVTDYSQLDHICTIYKDSPIWIKFSHAFGGSDLLAKINTPLTPQKIAAERDKIRQVVDRSLIQNSELGLNIDQMWPADSFSPDHYALTVEQDLAAFGKIVAVGSNLMTIDHNGRSSTEAYFQQVVAPNGDFMGSMICNPEEVWGAAVKSELDHQFQEIARYAADELSMYGIVGVDFIIVRSKHDGTLIPFMLELNARPPISACSYIVGTTKLEAPAWISRYVWAKSGPLNTMADFEDMVTVDGNNYARTESTDKGMIIPMHLSSLYEDRRIGRTLNHAQNWAQILIAGSSVGHCLELQRKLGDRQGVSFQAPNQ